VLARLGRTRGQRFVGVEMLIALDGKPEWAAQVPQFVHTDEAKFWASHAKIAEAEGDVIEPELGEEPGALRVRSEEFHDGGEVDVGLFAVHAGDLRLAIGDELFGLCFGEECHLRGSLC